jgi:hypothetical protein
MIKPTATDYIREYLVRMAEIRGTGGATKETSYYSALENILDHFGKDLRPRVICNGQLKNQGAGNPDFGLYTKAQIQGGEPSAFREPFSGSILACLAGLFEISVLLETPVVESHRRRYASPF